MPRCSGKVVSSRHDHRFYRSVVRNSLPHLSISQPHSQVKPPHKNWLADRGILMTETFAPHFGQLGTSVLIPNGPRRRTVPITTRNSPIPINRNTPNNTQTNKSVLSITVFLCLIQSPLIVKVMIRQSTGRLYEEGASYHPTCGPCNSADGSANDSSRYRANSKQSTSGYASCNTTPDSASQCAKPG